MIVNKPIYEYIKEELQNSEFLMIIGKYDHILGPIYLYESFPLIDKRFIQDLLRDALNTKNKFVIINFGAFYAQVNKINIEDLNARGKRQLYAIILLRDHSFPSIPIAHLHKIELIFLNIDDLKILSNDTVSFKAFFNKINQLYREKNLFLLPAEEFYLNLRNSINTISGFGELILEEVIKDGVPNTLLLKSYVVEIIDTIKDITSVLNDNKFYERFF